MFVADRLGTRICADFETTRSGSAAVVEELRNAKHQTIGPRSHDGTMLGQSAPCERRRASGREHGSRWTAF